MPSHILGPYQVSMGREGISDTAHITLNITAVANNRTESAFDPKFFKQIENYLNDINILNGIGETCPKVTEPVKVEIKKVEIKSAFDRLEV